MIIGISGKKGSGKDLIAKIIQVLVDNPNSLNDVPDNITEGQIMMKIWDRPTFSIHRFADAIKHCTCILIGCTREQLEDREFKETPLSEQWWYYDLGNETKPYGFYTDPVDAKIANERYLVKITPRIIFKKLGENMGRKVFGPNVWINSLFGHYSTIENLESQWIIPDLRYPNEFEKIKEYNNFTIRVNRWDTEVAVVQKEVEFGVEYIPTVIRTPHSDGDTHPSETSLDGMEDQFDHVIDNEGTIKDLIDKVREILKKEKLIPF